MSQHLRGRLVVDCSRVQIFNTRILPSYGIGKLLRSGRYKPIQIFIPGGQYQKEIAASHSERLFTKTSML